VAAARREEERRRARWTPGVKRALMVVCVFFVFQQITGINVPLYYGPHLLGPVFAGNHSTKIVTTMAGVEVTSIMTAVNVAATYFAFRWIDRIGRRKLARAGYAGMAAAALVSAVGLGVLTGLASTIVTMVGLDAFIASFAIGATVDWLANFALIEVFPTWQKAIGLSWVLVCFAGLCLVAVGFVQMFLPETKGHSVEEITRLFEKEGAHGAAESSAT
jgi:MFS family permease